MKQVTLSICVLLFSITTILESYTMFYTEEIVCMETQDTEEEQKESKLVVEKIFHYILNYIPLFLDVNNNKHLTYNDAIYLSIIHGAIDIPPEQC